MRLPPPPLGSSPSPRPSSCAPPSPRVLSSPPPGPSPSPSLAPSRSAGAGCVQTGMRAPHAALRPAVPRPHCQRHHLLGLGGVLAIQWHSRCSYCTQLQQHSLHSRESTQERERALSSSSVASDARAVFVSAAYSRDVGCVVWAVCLSPEEKGRGGSRLRLTVHAS